MPKSEKGKRVLKKLSNPDDFLDLMLTVMLILRIRVGRFEIPVLPVVYVIALIVVIVTPK